MNSEERKREREKDRTWTLDSKIRDFLLLIEKKFNMATRIRVKKKKNASEKRRYNAPLYLARELNSEGREHNESRRLIQK